MKEAEAKIAALEVAVSEKDNHVFELEVSKKVAIHYGIDEHSIIDIDLAQFGGSALTSNKIKIPRGRKISEMNDIPATYVPARNTIFLSIMAIIFFLSYIILMIPR